MAAYLWSTGATTQCITVSQAGSYTVTVTSQDGCISSCNKTLTVNPAGTSAITGSGSVCAGNSVQWCAPAGLASYLWSTGATTQCIVVSSAGTYSVTTTNGSGCISNSSKTLTINPLPACQISGSTSICTGSSTSWCASPGMASYLWSTGATTKCVTLSAAGTYTVTITNNKGCQSTCSKTLTLTQGGNSSISGNASVCTGNSIIWCAPAGMASYLWSTGATTQCITVSTSGTYTVTTSNGIGCISSSSKTLTVKQLPVFQISGSTALCAGKTTTWCAPAGMASYSWSTGATTQCVTFSAAGTYTVTVTNNNGCTYSNSKTLVAWQNPTCSITGYTDICQGESTSLCGPQAAGNSFLWSTGATTRCISVSAVGPYTLTVYNQGGCSKSCQVNVTYKTPQSCCSGFRAHTNSEWGANPSGTNAGAYLQQHFAAAFPGPGYLTIGCTNLLRLTSAQAVNDFLPSFGSGGTLPAGTLTNPGATFSQTLAGHAVALTLNIKFDLTFANFGSSSTHLKDLYVASGPFTGLTVEQVLAEANNKLGGCGSSYSTTALTDVLASINSNFSDGFTNEGFLYCPFAVRPDLGFLSDQPAAGISARAYPNPFESTTTIEFRNSASSANTRVELFNATGIRVAVLFEGSMAADELKRLTFHGEGFADGIYFYRISSDEQVFNGRLVLLRKE